MKRKESLKSILYVCLRTKTSYYVLNVTNNSLNSAEYFLMLLIFICTIVIAQCARGKKFLSEENLVNCQESSPLEEQGGS